VFVITTTIASIGENVEIEVFMPQFERFNFSLKSLATVIRTSYPEGFAAVGDFTFHRVG